MNIFVIDEQPKIAAQHVLDKHVVKMPLESLQMMSTIANYLGFDSPYRPVMLNHPCTIWARESSQNYSWLYAHFLALGTEYTFRYGKEHASVVKLAKPLMQFPKNIKQGEMTPLAQAMPDEYKHEDPIVAYRRYVINEKHYAKWEKGRSKPKWWNKDYAEALAI